MIIGVARIGPGIVPLEEWRDAQDAAAAVGAFCARHQTPKNPADYIGIDPGWASVQRPSDGYVWAWDFDLATLVQARSPSLEYRLSVQVRGEAQLVITTDWETVGGVVTTPALQGDLAKISAAMTGQALVSGTAEIRIIETDDLGVVVDMMPTPLPLADSGGGYQTWVAASTVPPSSGRNTYEVQARIGAPGDSASVRFTSMALVVDG